MSMLWSAGNLYLHISYHTVHVYVYDLTLTHFQQKGHNICHPHVIYYRIKRITRVYRK
jgi:hypothetical protein